MVPGVEKSMIRGWKRMRGDVGARVCNNLQHLLSGLEMPARQTF
jgi:hypothetical protein